MVLNDSHIWAMQRMSPTASDTHDHGPPDAITYQTKSALRQHTPFPSVAVWTTKLTSGEIAAFSGAMAGMVSGIVTCPLDVIKTKLQAQGSFSNPGLKHAGPSSSAIYQGMIGTARTIIRQDGLKGMYRGLGPMLLGYLPTWAVFMAVYDTSKEWYKSRYGAKDSEALAAKMYASITAGACSTLATNPIWVIKTRLMSQVSSSANKNARTPWHYHNTMDAFRKMYRAEGIGAFYSGLGPALLGLTHVAIQFPLYEYFKQRFTGLEMGQTSEKHGEGAKNTAGVLAATFLSKTCATTATYPHEVLRTRLQTQQRHSRPESRGISGAHHSQSLSAKRTIGNSDGLPYQPKYKGIISTCRIILREEGWRAFYNGMGTNMIRAIPAAMTTMLTYESVRSAIGRMQEEGKEIMKESS